MGRIRKEVMRSLVLLAIVFSMGVSAGNWPTYMGAQGDGIGHGEKILRKAPTKRWSVKVNQGYGGAAIVDGKVYILDRIADAKDKLRVFDLASGSIALHAI